MKNISEPLYLSAREAARELSVSPATLYAYVSRGRIGMEPDPHDPRRSRYRADDIAALAGRDRQVLDKNSRLHRVNLPGWSS